MSTALPMLTAEARPRTRGECVDGPRPCRFVTCVHHLFVEVASVRTKSRIATLEAMPETCTLDVADRGGAKLEEVGIYLAITRERARQIELVALAKLRDSVDEEMTSGWTHESERLPESTPEGLFSTAFKRDVAAAHDRIVPSSARPRRHTRVAKPTGDAS